MAHVAYAGLRGSRDRERGVLVLKGLHVHVGVKLLLDLPRGLRGEQRHHKDGNAADDEGGKQLVDAKHAT